MPGHPGLACQGDEIAEADGSRKPHLRHQDAPPPRFHIVPDLHEVIEPRAGPKHGIPPRPPVDTGVGADLNKIAEDHPPQLGDGDEAAVRGDGEAEPFLPHPRPRCSRTPARPGYG